MMVVSDYREPVRHDCMICYPGDFTSSSFFGLLSFILLRVRYWFNFPDCMDERTIPIIVLEPWHIYHFLEEKKWDAGNLLEFVDGSEVLKYTVGKTRFENQPS